MQKRTTIRGVVEVGRQLGRTLGFPTANVRLSDPMVPPQAGVWFARVTLEATGQRLWGLVNVGRRPTIEHAGEWKAEAWLLDFEGNLYGQAIAIELLRFLRPERKFDSLDALREAMLQDKQHAINIIDNHEFTL